MVALPPPLSTHLYMSLLSCRFDAEQPATTVWDAPGMCDLVREARRAPNLCPHPTARA